MVIITCEQFNIAIFLLDQKSLLVIIVMGEVWGSFVWCHCVGVTAPGKLLKSYGVVVISSIPKRGYAIMDMLTFIAMDRVLKSHPLVSLKSKCIVFESTILQRNFSLGAISVLVHSTRPMTAWP